MSVRNTIRFLCISLLTYLYVIFAKTRGFAKCHTAADVCGLCALSVPCLCSVCDLSVPCVCFCAQQTAQFPLLRLYFRCLVKHEPLYYISVHPVDASPTVQYVDAVSCRWLIVPSSTLPSSVCAAWHFLKAVRTARVFLFWAVVHFCTVQNWSGQPSVARIVKLSVRCPTAMPVAVLPETRTQALDP
jgi:hypothetical protein